MFGLLDIEVIAAGSIFLGQVHEPIRGTKNPQAMLQSGIEFTKRPKAIRFDYKTKLASSPNRVRSTGFSRKTTIPGRDSIAVILLLQKRWEDKEGNVYSKRVGTMVHPVDRWLGKRGDLPDPVWRYHFPPGIPLLHAHPGGRALYDEQ